LIFQTYDQYVLPSERINADHFQEVRKELGFTDLVITGSQNRNLVEWLSGTVHREAPKFAARWMDFGRHQIDDYAHLRNEQLRWHERIRRLEHLHDTAGSALNSVGRWAPSDDSAHVDT
ncbi:MAG TPA: hypothetical protein VH352_05820, partial [Pseudonocardiaceae bacterium]|nr:hypothetical protein [Pseudonocardiaceae bacterium]